MWLDELGKPSDTPKHIRDLQLKIWLSKPPMERLRIYIEENELIFNDWMKRQRKREEEKNQGKANQG